MSQWKAMSWLTRARIPKGTEIFLF
jgi:hypothetical protein